MTLHSTEHYLCIPSPWAHLLCPQFTYLEPSEVRTWQTPTPAASKKVEMDRTVMPGGTVVTTITAVKCKPGRLLPPGLTIGKPRHANHATC